MPASQASDLYDFEYVLEAYKRISASKGLPMVMPMRSDAEMSGERQEVEINFTGFQQRRRLDPSNSRNWYYDVANLQMEIRYATRRHVGAERDHHRKSVARLIFMFQQAQGGVLWSEEVLPYHAVQGLKVSGVVPEIYDAGAEDVTRITLQMEVSIRANAWPTGV